MSADVPSPAAPPTDDEPPILRDYKANPTPIFDVGAEYGKQEYHDVKVHKQNPGMPDSVRPRFFHWLKTSTTVVDLRLVHCNIGDHTLLKNLLKALQPNNTIRKVDLTDNNLSCKAMLLFIDRLEPYNYSIIDLVFNEGNKSLEDKGRQVHESWGAMLQDVIMNEPEPMLEKKKVQPRVAQFCQWNKDFIDADVYRDGRDLNLNFSGRMSEKFLLRFDKGATARPRPLRTDMMDKLFAEKARHVRSVLFDSWYPPPPATHPEMLARHEQKLRKREQQAAREFAQADTQDKKEEALSRRPKLEKQGKDRQAAFALNYQIPESFWDLPLLEDVRVYNSVRVDEWKDPSSDRRVRVVSTFWKEIPASMTQLKRLKILTISKAGLERVDGVVLAGLPLLETLNLPGNELTELPPQIGLLRRLIRLSVHSNRLRALPDAILQLTNLQELLAYKNYLQSLPTSITQFLTNLQDLKAVVQRERGSNSTRPLSPAVAALMRDEEKATQAKPPVPFKGLKAFLAEVARAGTVKVNRCKLMFVGDGGIGKTKLAAAITLETQPKDVKKARKREKEEAKKLAKEEKKRAIAGEEPATALSSLDESASLQRETEDDDLDKRFTGIVNQATDGIDIHDIKIQADVSGTPSMLEKSGGIQFSCWDFAGQDVYYNTHTFFLTDRSIYLVGFNATHEETKSFSRVEYWLQSISARLPGAPIIIFGTHCDDPKCSKQYLKTLEEKIKEKFQKRFRFVDIVWIKNTNEYREKSVQKLLKVIVKIATSKNFKKRLGIDEECPSTYYHLEEKARSLKAERVVPTMRFQEWVQVANRDFSMPTENIVQATQYLHNLGSVLWFNEDGLRDVVILDPQWLTQVFAALVSAKTPITNGILKHENLPMLWRAYSEKLRPFMLMVLEKFEVLHRLEGNALSNVELSLQLLTTGNNVLSDPSSLAALASSTSVGMISQLDSGMSFVPALLGEQPPPQSDFERAWPSTEEDTTELSRVYKFEFLPNGFFARLMVRLLHSAWEANLFWKYGIVLSKELARLFMRYSPETKELSISVRGPDNSNKMGSLIESINTLIADWLKDVHIDIFIPHKSRDGKVHQIDVKTVEKAVHAGQSLLKVGSDDVRVDQLAPDLAMAGAVRGGALTEGELNLAPKELGRGGFAVVYRGTLRGEPVAVKKLLFTQAQEESGETTFSDVFGEFRREVWLMSSMQHENIVALKGVCTKPSLAMVLEFMESGNLYEYLHTKEKIDWEEKQKLALDVARGMQFMHTRVPPIIHRDLKTPNILLTRRDGGPYPTAKIADFGLSRGLVWQNSYADKVVDNPVWLAPEALQKKPYTEKVDVYAFGVILWEIATQKDYFGHLNFMSELEARVIAGERPRNDIPPDTPAHYRGLIEICWNQEPEKRPSFSQCVECLSRRIPIDTIQAAPSLVRFQKAPEAPQLRNARSQSHAAAQFSAPPPSRPAAQSIASPNALQRGVSTPMVSNAKVAAFASATPGPFPGTVTSQMSPNSRSVSTGVIQPTWQGVPNVNPSPMSSPVLVPAQATIDIGQYMAMGGFMPAPVQFPAAGAIGTPATMNDVSAYFNQAGYQLPPGISIPIANSMPTWTVQPRPQPPNQ